MYVRDQNGRMSGDYHRYPPGSPHHYAAYEKAFSAGDVDPVDVPEIEEDPEASYEIDNAWELAYDRRVEEGARQAAIEQGDAGVLGWVVGSPDEYGLRDPGLEVDMEMGDWF